MGTDDERASTNDDASGTPVIDADGATYEYADGTVAVDDVDLRVRPGEVHAVVGGNGAGKSTLSKLLVGLLKPTEGTVRIDGEPTTGRTARDLSESVGIALQNPDEQLAEQTITDEIRLPLERRQTESTGPFGLFGSRERYDDASIDERVEAVYDLLEPLDDRRDHDPLFLPRGERRLVTMGTALGADPAGIVLDEPMAGVDLEMRRTISGVVERLSADGTGVVLVEHDMATVCELADTVTVLDEGRVAVQGAVEDVFAPDNWDWLAGRYLEPPRIARLAQQLGTTAFTVDELVDALDGHMEVFQ